MNLRVLRYYTLDHPFERNEKVVYSDRSKAAETISQVYEIENNKRAEKARLLRIHISGEKRNSKEEIPVYEKSIQRKEKIDYNRAKVLVIMRFTRALLIGYLLYLAPETFWSPIVNVFNMVAHGLSDYARWCVIFFLPLKAFLRTFGTLFYIRGKVNLGIPGQWHKINEAAKTLNLYDKFGEDPRKEVEEAVDDYLDSLMKKSPEAEKLRKQLEPLLKEASLDKDGDKLNGALLDIIRKEESGPLWGEMIRLDSLREEILYFQSTGGEQRVPLYGFHPDGPDNPPPGHLMSLIRFRSFANQAVNLRKFYFNERVTAAKENLYRLKTDLAEAATKEDRIAFLEKACSSLEILRDEMSRFHMGENLLIPRDKVNDPVLYYHHLYSICGAALCELEKGYRRAAWGFLPLKSNTAGRKRISRMFRQIDRFLYGKWKSPLRNRMSSFGSSWGKTPARSLALSLIIIFAIGSLLGFYTAKPGEKAIRRSMRFGYKDQFINWSTEIEEPSSFTVGWHLPRPFESVNIVNGDKREIELFMIMGEHFTANPLSRLLADLSGQLGTRFDVVEMKITYSPGDTAVWSRYNSDGKGERRLLRDLSELAEEWRNIRGVEETSISNKEFDLYFRELAEKGILEEYLKRSFSQTTFSTNIYYGSLTERYDAGINAVLREFDIKLERMRSDVLTENEDIRAMEEALDQASTVVNDLKETVEDQVKLEYSLLRSDPELLEKLVSDPYGNAQKLKEFETIWINLANYIQYLYRQDELTEILSEGYIDMSLKEEALKLYPLHMKLADYLQENSLIGELIQIQSIEFNSKVIGLTEFTQYQEKWKETI